MTEDFTLVECPRDAMQGWKSFIPTKQKVEYLNTLLRVGFDVLDFGSFVSPKAIPQMSDTHEVLQKLDFGNSQTKLLAIVANIRGATAALSEEKVHFLGFPFSISETFQQRNTHKSIGESLDEVATIQALCEKGGKELVIYISMGFGNPYGDLYNAEIAISWVNKLTELGIHTFAMSDTIGIAQPEIISTIFSHLIPEVKDAEIGAHFHSRPESWREKVEAAYDKGCRRFDSSIRGIGGCPMAEDELVGNIATENLVQWCGEKKIPLSLNMQALAEATQMAARMFI